MKHVRSLLTILVALALVAPLTLETSPALAGQEQEGGSGAGSDDPAR